MAIDTKLITLLREKTGMGISACKKALEECGGDLEKAELALRKLGINKAAKKADRPTGEGVVAIAGEGRTAVMVEVCCEQEPTSKNERFLALVQKTLDLMLASKASSAEEVLRQPTEEGTLADTYKALIGVTSENIVLRRAARIEAPEGGMIGRYVHFNRKAGAICALRLEGIDPSHPGLQAAANDLCMHAVAARPIALRREDIPPEILAREKEVYAEEVKGKPENIKEKILEGKLSKFYAEKVLLEQVFVKDPEGKKTVARMIEEAAKAAGGKATVVAFTRFELGL